MPFLRYLMWMSLIVWLGGVIFFAAVLAPTVFTVLPTHQLAGNVVNRSLRILHWMGIVSALVFLASSMLYSRFTNGSAHPFAARSIPLESALGPKGLYFPASTLEVLKMQSAGRNVILATAAASSISIRPLDWKQRQLLRS